MNFKQLFDIEYLYSEMIDLEDHNLLTNQTIASNDEIDRNLGDSNYSN